MAPYIDFADLKERVTIEQALDFLGIELKKNPNGQLRGNCPIHDGSNPREFVVTPNKGLYYCFAGCGGGDIIKLVAKVKGCDQKEAAQLLAEQYSDIPAAKRTVTTPEKSTVTGKSTVTKELKPLDYLQPEQEGVQALGVSPETAQAFEAGYAPKGIMRGRFAIPIHDWGGTLVAYCGRAVTNESPTLTFPNGFDPSAYIFNAQKVTAGELYLVREPLQVLTAFENGVDNVVSFLTETITAQQLEQLASLMDERQCESVELF